MTTKNTAPAAASTNVRTDFGLVELRKFALGIADASKRATAASGHLIRAAIIGKDHFAETVETFYKEVRANVGGIAVKLGAEQSTKEPGTYVVPGNIRTPVSQILRSIKLGVDLGTEEAQKSAGDIRKATELAAEQAKLNTPPPVLTGDDAIKATLLKALADAASVIKAAEGATLESMRLVTANYCESMLKIVEGRKEAAPVAEAIAKAA